MACLDRALLLRAAPLGYVDLDHCELRLADGELQKVHLCRDRTKMLNGAAFLEHVIKAFPYGIQTVLTDNGMEFADLPKNRSGIFRQWGPNMFDRACLANGIEHKLTKPDHPWTSRAHEPDDQGCDD